MENTFALFLLFALPTKLTLNSVIISTKDCQREGTTKPPFCVTNTNNKNTKDVVNKRNKEELVKERYRLPIRKGINEIIENCSRGENSINLYRIFCICINFYNQYVINHNHLFLTLCTLLLEFRVQRMSLARKEKRFITFNRVLCFGDVCFFLSPSCMGRKKSFGKCVLFCI